MGSNGNSVDVDTIWNVLGRLGRYQKKQLIVMLVCIWSYGFHVLSIVFIGFKYPYACKEEETSNETSHMYNDSSTVWKTYETCSIKTHVNTSGSVTVTESPCTNGYSYDVDHDRTFVTEWDLICERSGFSALSQTLLMLGQATGAFIFTSLSDRYGRKPVTIGCHIALFLITLGTASVPTYGGFLALRFFTGLFQEGVGLTNAIMMLEMFPKEIRGYMEVMGLMFWTTGIALITPVGYLFRNISWRYMQVALACCSAWSLAHWWLVDESLRWLIANGKVEESKAIIRKACRANKKNFNEVLVSTGFRDWEHAMAYHRGKLDEQPLSDDKVPLELQEIKNGYNQNGIIKTTTDNKESSVPNKDLIARKYTVIDLIKSKRLLFVSMIMWLAWITNSLTYYGLMLISSTLAGNRFLNFFLGSIVEYPAAFLQFHSINRFGRKPTIVCFHALCCVALIIATVLTTTAAGNQGMMITSTVFTLIGKMAITGSFSTIFLTTPELYPTNMRTIGIGLTSTASRAGSMVAPFSENLAEAVPWAPGLIYGVLCAIVAVLALCLPETNNYELPQTLEECELWYKENSFKLPCRKRRKTLVDVGVQVDENQVDLSYTK